MTTESNSTSIVGGDLLSDLDGRYASWLIVAGAVLFVIPEPVTSVIGIVVLLAGILAWLAARAV